MISFENVSFGYGKKQIFSGLNFKIEPGSICGLLGKNGAGKTTLLNLMNGFLFPDFGKYAVAGYVPEKRQPDFLREIYTVGEEILSLNLKPDDYLKYNVPFYPKLQKAHLDKFLDDFKVDKNEKLKEMSQGNRKKFFLAFAFAVDSSVLILDEPTNGLDIPSKIIFRKMVAEIIDENKTIIISTHQVRDLESLIDPVIILDSGKIIFNHSIAEIQEKLFFSISKNELKEALYSEKVPSGWANVTDKEISDEEVKGIDVQFELLFNAVLNNQNKIVRIFEKEA